MKKKLFFIALLISGLGLNAQSVGDTFWPLDNGVVFSMKITSLNPAECMCTGASENIISSITIPSNVIYEDYQKEFIVTSISGESFGYDTDLTGIHIPSTVKIIEEGAFRGCTNLSSVIFDGNSQLTSLGSYAFQECALKSIEIPNGITSLGDGTFQGCTCLTSVKIPNGVTSLGDYNFKGCSSLTSMEIPSGVVSIGDGSFEDCVGLKSVTFANNSQLTSLGISNFEDCSSLSNINIPKGITSLEDGNFKNCSSLTSVEIPDNVTYIGKYTFSGCSSLTSIVIPSRVATIESTSFDGCIGLKKVTFADNSQLKTIKYDTFKNCSSLTEITFGKNSVLTNIGSNAFWGCTSLQKISLKDNLWLEEIDSNAFTDCSSLTSIEFPESLASIGLYAFEGCTSLTSIKIPKLVSIIPLGVFKNCSKLTSIELPVYVVSIFESAFEGCISLESIEYNTIGIGDNAFKNCSSLTKMTCTASVVPETSSTAFSGCPSNMTIAVLQESLESYKASQPWKQYDLKGTASAPSKVSDYVSVQKYEDHILVKWSMVPGVYQYKVYKNDEYYTTVAQCYYEDYYPSSGNNCYKIASVDITTLSELGFSDEVCDGEAYETQLIAPRNVKAISYSSYVRLEWSKVDGAKKYKIYRNNTYLTTVTDTYYSDNSVESGNTYCYKVKSVNDTEESDYSVEACVTLEDESGNGLQAPKNLTLSFLSETEIILEWDAVAGAETYNIYVEGYYLGYTDQNGCVIEGIEPGVEACFTVTSVRGNEESAHSKEACTTDSEDDNPEEPGEGIEELASAFFIYPNPVNDKLYIETELEIEKIIVYDIYGIQQTIGYGQQLSSIDVSELNSGVYFVKIITNKAEFIKHFVKR